MSTSSQVSAASSRSVRYSRGRMLNDYSHVFDKGRRAAKQRQWFFEVSWEVANRLGGIYTVIKSKVVVSTEELGEQYCLVGPYVEATVWMEVELIDPTDSDPAKKALKAMRDMGFKLVYGRWLVEGYPKVILFDIVHAMPHLDAWKKEIWEKSKIGIPWSDRDANEAVVFGFLTALYLQEFKKALSENSYVVAHFHEWTSGIGLLTARTRHIELATIFTTHATTLGRHLCAGKVDFYNNISKFQLDKEAGDRSIYQRYCIERAAAHCAHVFTTVSEITNFEVEHILGRKSDIILPNGLNVKYSLLHEFQNKHSRAKEKINDFVRGHFHGHFDFDLEKTLYYFTAGRYEYTNKGADFVIESCARLNYLLKAADSKVTVIMFLIFPTRTNNFNVESLRGQAIAKQLRDTVTQIQKEVGQRLFDSCLRGILPDGANLLLPEDLIRLKRCIYAARSKSLPPVCTHNVADDGVDPILLAIRRCKLFNDHSDRVKVVFHPEFLSETNPLFGLEYDEFVRGCNLGVFPSYYEPWGYTPAECTIWGIPSITTNLSGFGCFMEEQVTDVQSYGIYVVDRHYKTAEESIHQLSTFMHDFSQQTRRQRIIQRNRTERLSELLDWRNLGLYYRKARCLALHKLKPDLFKVDNTSTFKLDPNAPAISSGLESSRTTPAHSDIDDDSDEERRELSVRNVENASPAPIAPNRPSTPKK